MALGDGRNQVVPDSIIDPDWGNAIADRTNQTYANAADRDAQWVTPQDGAICYTADTDTFWFHDNGKWMTWPIGLVGYLDGPTKNLDMAINKVEMPVLAYSFPARINRHYLVSASSGAAVVKGQGYVHFYVKDDYGETYGMVDDNDNMHGVGPSGVPTKPNIHGTTTFVYVPVTTHTGKVTVLGWFAANSTAAATLRFFANKTHISVVDVGGP